MADATPPKMTIDDFYVWSSEVARKVTGQIEEPALVAYVMQDGEHMKFASLAAFFERIRPIGDALRACVMDHTIAALAVKIHANPGAISAIYAVLNREEAKRGQA